MPRQCMHKPSYKSLLVEYRKRKYTKTWDAVVIIVSLRAPFVVHVVVQQLSAIVVLEVLDSKVTCNLTIVSSGRG